MSDSLRLVRRRARRNKQHHRVPFLLRSVALAALLLLAPLGALLLLGGMGVLTAVAYFNQSLPDIGRLEALPQELLQPYEGSKLYAWGDPRPDGSREAVLIYQVRDPLGTEREWLQLMQTPPILADAVLTAVTVNAPSSSLLLPGDDPASIVLAQQLTDQILLPGSEPDEAPTSLRAYRQRLERLVVARQVAQRYDQAQLLEWHLNTAYYGNLAYGIQAAARVYLNKRVGELTLAEAALLAPLPYAPHLNPIDAPEAAKAQQMQILEALLANGRITRDQFASAQFAPLPPSPAEEARFDVIAPHFALYVRRQLEALVGAQALLRGGLHVYTTLDLTMQRQAECVARAQVARLSGQVGELLPPDERAACAALAFLPPLPGTSGSNNRNVSNAAVVMLDPTTGEIRALVGSLNYWDTHIGGALNMATDGLRQPGSALQPFIYLTALSQGYTAATMVLDVETDFGALYEGRTYVPQNEDGRFHGPMRLRQALGSSYNVPAVQVLSWVGVPRLLRTAQNLGLTTLNEAAASYSLSIALGGGQVHLLEMAYAYSVLANMGEMVGQARQTAAQAGERPLDPVAIVRIEDSTGRVLVAYDQPQRREISPPQLAFLLNDMLSDHSARCAAFGCPNLLELPNNRPAAVQTGSTNDFRDAWTIGYTPQLVTAVWVGNTDNRPMVNVGGYEGAAPIWQALMAWALQAEPVELWSPPPGMVEQPVCDISGLRPTPICPTVLEWFISGTEPLLFDTIFQEFAVNRENGRLATFSTPPDLIERRIYRVYPEAATTWARANGIEQPPSEYDTLSVTAVGTDVAIRSPQPFAHVRGQVSITGTVALADLAYYRLAYFAGLTPVNLRTIGANVAQRVTNGRLGVWDVENLQGLYTLVLTAVRQDGSFVELSLPVTVDNTPPTVELLSPLSGQEFLTAARWVTIEAQASDNLAIARVDFYLDEAERPFASSKNPPYSQRWPARAPGCHTVRAVAVDLAGNADVTTAVTFCVVNQNSNE